MADAQTHDDLPGPLEATVELLVTPQGGVCFVVGEDFPQDLKAVTLFTGPNAVVMEFAADSRLLEQPLHRDLAGIVAQANAALVLRLTPKGQISEEFAVPLRALADED